MMISAGIDIGGSKIDVLGDTGDGELIYQRWLTADFGSVNEVLERTSLVLGGLDRTVIAAAGRQASSGIIELTNVPWPAFRPRSEKLVNDVQCAAGATRTLRDDEIRDLNGVTTDIPESVTVAVSTGENSAFCDASGTVHPSETGHTGWQPWYDVATDELSVDFLRYLQRMVYPGSTVVTVEDAISGNRGFDNLYDFVSTIITPGREFIGQVRSRRLLQRGIGSVVTQAALAGDRCAEMCMQLWGPILGQYLRERALSHLTRGGTIWLYGGVVTGEGVMDFVVNHTDFTRHFIGGSAKMCDLMKQIALKLVVPSAKFPFAVRGALELARRV